MSGTLQRPRRYQLNRDATEIVASGHPWLFRGQMSSAADVFADGQWLALFDGQNRVVGYGVFAAEGAVAVRILEHGTRRPDADWLRSRLDAALAKRLALRKETDGFRALHGENDGLPAIVVDVYGDTAVLMTFAAGLDGLGRLAAGGIARRLGLKHILWKPARRRQGEASPARILRGQPAELVGFREGKRRITVDPWRGQKSGGFLDLRGLRRWVAGQPLAEQRVLNLFSYTGTLGQAAATAGAAEIWQVDSSQEALDFAVAHHGAAGHKLIAADIFEWLPHLDRHERFDLVIVDPPSMTSQAAQAGRALAAYDKLYRAVLPHLNEGGTLVACCCTSRIAPNRFREAVDRAVGDSLRLEQRLPAEPDHPVGFAEGDYLKVLIYRSRE